MRRLAWTATWLSGAWMGLLLGCFSEPQVELPPGCSLGQHLCPCDGDKCDPGLTCSVSSDYCVALDCQVGALECPCGMDGACNPGLVCFEDKYCTSDGGSGSATTVDTMTGSASNSMSGGVTSDSDATATDSTTTDPTATDPTATDPTVTDPTATDPTTTDPTDASMTDASMTDATASDSSTSDSSMTDGSTDASGGAATCFDCIQDGTANACASEYQDCQDAALMMPQCSMTTFTLMMCAMGAGGSDEGCLCIANDALGQALTMCLSGVCGAECSCF